MKFKIIAVLVLLNSAMIYAAFDLEGLDDIEVIETKIDKTTTKKENNDFLDKDLAITMGGSSLVGNDKNGRSYGYLRARYEKKWDIFKLNYEGLFEDIKISVTQKEKDTKVEKTNEYHESQYRTEELYLNIDLMDNLSLSVGKQKIIWGQLEPYSPTNFAFPIKLGTTSVKFSKASGALAQNVAKLSFYPTERVLFEATYFVEAAQDTLLKNKFKKPGTFEQPTTYNATENSFNVIEKKVVVDLPKGSDKAMQGFRIISYQDWGTIGVSYFDGFEANGAFEQHTLKKVEDSGKTIYYKDQIITLNKQKMIGIELSMPFDKWTVKFEYALFKKNSDVTFHRDIDPSQAQIDYAEYILNENKGKLYIPSKMNAFALGFSAQLKRWDLNFVLFKFDETSEKLAKLEELKEKAYPTKDSTSIDVFPGMLVSYYLNEDKISSVSLAAGIVGNGAGAILSYSTELIDSLEFSIGYQSITYFSDAVTDEDNDGKYERESTSVNGVIVGVEYSF